MPAFLAGAPTVSVAATTTSAATDGVLRGWRQFPQLQIANAGPDTVFVAHGIATQLPSGTTTAATTDYPVLAGATVIVTKGASDIVALRTLSTTATVYLTPGSGD